MKDESKPAHPLVDIRESHFQYALRALRFSRYLDGHQGGTG
jgi:hypothetical protein